MKNEFTRPAVKQEGHLFFDDAGCSIEVQPGTGLYDALRDEVAKAEAPQAPEFAPETTDEPKVEETTKTEETDDSDADLDAKEEKTEDEEITPKSE